ncbi:hypothetical protein Amico_1666 [Aminobacterium colombiense DSM 12261]|jgi:hypothetical protein|uniref:Uncharacterized protein n=1 Tax=Aminobacterium colombiense (strain DSM 12261 / ALA-1) TaxID=572547 RepID=D5EGV0_AMICL|nr:hypothetical protein Amico_1666 [Aminobacterium colombiense DSM 12261]
MQSNSRTIAIMVQNSMMMCMCGGPPDVVDAA